MHLLIKWSDLDALLLNDGLLLWVGSLRGTALPALTTCSWSIAEATFLSCAHGHVELSYFMGVLAGCRHLDWSSPVEVEVAEGVAQLLQLDLLQG